MDFEKESRDSRLSAITTNWEEIVSARGDSAGDARNKVLIRYAPCVYQYIAQATKDVDIADELSQEFALRFVRGDYKNADPAKGRFRAYLRTSLRNLITDHFRKNKEFSLTSSEADRLPDKSIVDMLAALDQGFQEDWREYVLSLAWNALLESDFGRSSDYYPVLKFRSLHPTATSKQMAAQLSEQLGKPVTAEWVRQKIVRSRQKFARLLAAEVRRSLNDKSEEAIREELAALGLLKYLET